MKRRIDVLVRVATGVLLLAISACASVQTRYDAQQGDVYAQLSMYMDALHAGRGGKPDLPQAEHWLAAIAKQDVQYRARYASYLLTGRFGHIDEAAALNMALSAPRNDKTAQAIIAQLSALQINVAVDFPYWQKVYAETRPLCPDKDPGADTPANELLRVSRSAFDFALLPDSIQPGMNNLHAYIMLARQCPFTTTEQLNDPAAYRALSDWFKSTVWDQKEFANQILSYAAKRFPADSKSRSTTAVADPKGIALVRFYLLGRYKDLYSVSIDESGNRLTADCYIAAADIKDQFEAKKFADAVKAVHAAQQGVCKGGYQKMFLEPYAIMSLNNMNAYGLAYTRGLNALREGPLEGDVGPGIVHLLEMDVSQLKAWQDVDQIIAALQSSAPDMKGLTF